MEAALAPVIRLAAISFGRRAALAVVAQCRASASPLHCRIRDALEPELVLLCAGAIMRRQSLEECGVEIVTRTLGVSAPMAVRWGRGRLKELKGAG